MAVVMHRRMYVLDDAYIRLGNGPFVYCSVRLLILGEGVGSTSCRRSYGIFESQLMGGEQELFALGLGYCRVKVLFWAPMPMPLDGVVWMSASWGWLSVMSGRLLES